MAKLDDIGPFRDWVANASPPLPVWRAVRYWIAGLASMPWQAPSVPFPELSAQPRHEVRSAVVPESGGVEVVYVYWYEPVDKIDLVFVT